MTACYSLWYIHCSILRSHLLFGGNMRIKIAVVQFAIHQFAPEKNLEKAEQFIKEAVSQQAHIIVFPEDFVTGPVSTNQTYADYEGRYIMHFQHLSAQYSIDLVAGSIIEGNGT